MSSIAPILVCLNLQWNQEKDSFQWYVSYSPWKCLFSWLNCGPRHSSSTCWCSWSCWSWCFQARQRRANHWRQCRPSCGISCLYKSNWLLLYIYINELTRNWAFTFPALRPAQDDSACRPLRLSRAYPHQTAVELGAPDGASHEPRGDFRSGVAHRPTRPRFFHWIETRQCAS